MGCSDPGCASRLPGDEAFDERRTLRDPKLAARVWSFIDELIWYVRALASLGRRTVEPGSR